MMEDKIKLDITNVINKTQGLCWLSDDGKLVEKTSMKDVSVVELWDYLCENKILCCYWRFRMSKRVIVINTDFRTIMIIFNMRGKFIGYRYIDLDYYNVINYMRIPGLYKYLDIQNIGDKADYCKFSKLLDDCKWYKLH